jgi:hypothetical protein
MRQHRSSGSVEGVLSNEHPYSELRNPYPRPFYRQVIPTGFATECLAR